jgi:hypothetical protein
MADATRDTAESGLGVVQRAIEESIFRYGMLYVALTLTPIVVTVLQGYAKIYEKWTSATLSAPEEFIFNVIGGFFLSFITMLLVLMLYVRGLLRSMNSRAVVNNTQLEDFLKTEFTRHLPLIEDLAKDREVYEQCLETVTSVTKEFKRQTKPGRIIVQSLCEGYRCDLNKCQNHFPRLERSWMSSNGEN